MNALNDFDPARQQARNWSAHLGELSAAAPHTARPMAPSRFSAVLAHILQRSRAQQAAAQKLRSNEFLVGD
jgi:hypothetical protein